MIAVKMGVGYSLARDLIDESFTEPMKRLFSACLFPFLVFAANLSAAGDDDFSLLPMDITLSGPEGRHRIIAVKTKDGVFSGEIRTAKFSTSNPSVVEVAEGVLIAKGNGTAIVTARVGKKIATAAVEVKQFDSDFAWSFSNHVLPVLSRHGCNTGGCHGAIAGKGGFRLSLDGYDPPTDFYTMTREMQGRRIELAAPGRSLILTKPTMAAPHKGGKQLDTRSFDYRVLAEWIANGAAAPHQGEAKLDHLEVLPRQSLLQPGDSQQLIVRAHYNDGRTEDVTHWAKFTATDATVAQVTEDGKVTVLGHGEGAVVVWFSSRIVLSRVTSPFQNKIPDQIFTEAKRANFIDDLVLAQLKQLKLKPSRRTTDEEFCRRIYLDTIGTLPRPEEVTEFIQNKDPHKRKHLIEHLFQRKEFVDYWTYRWSDIFLVNGRLLRPAAVNAYYQWIRKNVEQNTSWDDFARELVTAKGSSHENGATNFYAVHQEPETMAENVSQAFLCLSINCARCHNHPLEKWTNDQYYSFANLFSRVRSKGWGGDARNGDGLRTLYVEPRGDLIQPRTGKPQIPAPLDGKELDPQDPGDRREHLADWLTSPENPYFARAITNRIWAAFFGIGLVDPVDDLRVSNPASNEPLLEALSHHLVKNDFDVRSVMRVILESETYHRASEVIPENRDDRRYFSRYYPRRLMAEILHDAITGITDSPSAFGKIILRDGSSQKTDQYKTGTRALQLHDSAVESYFLKTFGRNSREITCECERSNEPSMVQVLHLSNGKTLNENLSKKDGVVDAFLKSGQGNGELVDSAYLMCLSRKPTPAERRQFVEILHATSPKEKKTTVEDLFWALMTSREFLFQH